MISSNFDSAIQLAICYTAHPFSYFQVAQLLPCPIPIGGLERLACMMFEIFESEESPRILDFVSCLLDTLKPADHHVSLCQMSHADLRRQFDISTTGIKSCLNI